MTARIWRWVKVGAGLVAAALLAKTLGWPGKDTDGADSQDDGSGYQIRDGEVIWQPTSRSGRVAATVMTLGMAAHSEIIRGRPVPLADPETFRALCDDYGRDEIYVWFQGKLIDGADPDRFTILGYGFSRDEARIWQGHEPVFSLDDAHTEVHAHSERIVSIGPQTWLTADPPILLSETPAAKPEHYCRDWFTMNDALWMGSSRVMDLKGPTEVLDCDGSVRTRFEDGQRSEDLAYNQGILIRDGAEVWRATLTAPPMLLASLPDPIKETRLLGRGAGAQQQMLLARTGRGDVFAVAMNPELPAQRLGRFADLPSPDDISLDQGFWIEGRYFTINAPREPDRPLVADHGPAERFAGLALADGALLFGSHVVARPGDLPLREVGPTMVLVGPSCLSHGNFITDVADPRASAEEIRGQCASTGPRRHILYEGLRIAFHPALENLGPSAEHLGMTDYRLGEIVIENTTAQVQHVPVSLLQGLTLSVARSSIAPPPNAWPETALRLAPSHRHSWPLRAHTNDRDPSLWGWVLRMRHSPARVPVFGDEPFPVSRGSFLED